MAGSRLPQLSTIFGRVHGLLRTGAMKETDKPLWYDVYAAFPPKERTSGSEEHAVRHILYPEDRIRARFYRQFGSFGTVNLFNTSVEYKSLGQEFVLKFQDLRQQNPTLTEEEVFEKTVGVMRGKGMLPSSGSRAGERMPETSNDSDKITSDKEKRSNIDLSQIME